MEVMCFAIFACAFNLLLGFSKMLSFGHAAYFGASAYLAGWLMTTQNWDPAFAIMAGMGLSMVLGAIIGGIAIRREGIYFAMITLALAQVVYFVFLQAPFTGGENGLQSIPAAPAFGFIPTESDPGSLLSRSCCNGWSSCCLSHVLCTRPFGQILKAIRENEDRAPCRSATRSSATNSPHLCSRPGCLAWRAPSKRWCSALSRLTDVSQGNSGEVILMTLVGGTGTFFGPVLGAGIVVPLQEYLSDRVGSWVSVIIGCHLRCMRDGVSARYRR